MSTDNKELLPPGEGHAWRGDWQKRLKSRLSELEYSSLVEYSLSRPLATFSEMIQELGPGDFAQVQLHQELVRESKEMNQLWSFALHMLVTFLRDMPPNRCAHQEQENFTLLERLIAWQSSLPKYMHDDCRMVTNSVMQDKTIPAGWLPDGIDDVFLRPHVLRWPADRLDEEGK